MRPILALTAAALLAPVVAAPTAAWACPPPPPGYVPPTPEQRLRERVALADAIIDVRIEQSIGHGRYREGRQRFSGRPGSVRVVAVHKGDFRPGQHLRMYGRSIGETSCTPAYNYRPRNGRAGGSGLVFLYQYDLARGEPLPFYEFIAAADAAEMRRLGLIR